MIKTKTLGKNPSSVYKNVWIMRFKPAKERKRYKDIAMGTPSPYGQRMIKIEM